MSCFYCEKGEELDKLMVKVCSLSVSDIYLVRNQNFPGRCIAAYKEHKTELFQLEEKERNDFTKDIAITAKAIYELFQADKLNYAVYGDGVPHLHYHIVPKKKGGYCWGFPFDMNGNKTELDEKELLERAEMIREHIERQLR
ncbi:HIT family protein [Lachnospiraceae bacterium 62-35]